MLKEFDAIELNERALVGKTHVRKIRNDGFLPGILYGKAVNIKFQSTVKAFEKATRFSDVFPIKLAGKELNVRIRELQKHPVSRRPMHIDLQEVDLAQTLTVTVPLRYVGTAAGVKSGGVMTTKKRDIKLRCLAKDIPADVSVDVSNMGANALYYAKDLPQQPGVTYVIGDKFVLVEVITKKEAT